MRDKLQGLYAITDETLTPDTTVVSQVEEALKAGARIVQYRNKTASDEHVEGVCVLLKLLCEEHDAVFIIDDRAHLAQKIGAHGLHIGKDDMSLEEAREVFKGIIGVSCYGSINRAKQMQEAGADYVAFGSFFASPTKPQSGIVKLDILKKAKQELTIPVCAIGGINSDNIDKVALNGADMISVVSAVFSGDITQNTKKLIKGMTL